jgi:membrane protein
MTGGSNVKNSIMRKIVELYRYFSDKRYSTISGTLVYFLLMSVAPFLLWLTLIVGKIDLQQLFSDEVFSAVQPIVGYLKDSAESAASGAGIILLATSLYSSTNFFYHLRRSGEIIYGKKAGGGGLKIRFISLCLIIGAIAVLGLMAAVPLFAAQVLYAFMPYGVADSVSAIFLILSAWLVALLLNFFACPYKLDFDGAVCGSLLTTILWIILAVGFTIYLRFANPTKLYGKIASLIIFLLWCYVMINCLVIGIIQNEMYFNKRTDKIAP